MTRYYCSGFDIENAFNHGLGEKFLNELADTKSIVYIPGNPEKIVKAKEKYIPAFRNHFKNVGINFEKEILLTSETSPREAQDAIQNASFVMLMGGDPVKQKKMCEKLGVIDSLKKYNGVMLGFSAGAMLMSKYIIITPCSEEYPDFHIEEGLNLDDISIYPHNNTSQEEYPDVLVVGDETYQKEDLIKVANEYGEYYLLQDYLREDGRTDISVIKSTNGNLELYTENDGKIWTVTKDDIVLLNKIGMNYKRKI